MKLRRQPPAHSPVGLAAVLAGIRAAAGKANPDTAAQLRTRLNAAHVLLTDSGTTALQLAIRLADASAPVALPAWACYDVLSAAQGADAPIVWYDLDPTTLQPRAESLEVAAASGIGSVVLVHAYGVPVDVAAVRARLGPGVRIIEDAAQGWGGSLNGQPLGALGDLSVLSFGRGKGITGGSGGAFVVRAGAPWEVPTPPVQSAGWKDVLSTFVLLMLARPSLYGIPAALPFLRLGETVYKPPRPAARISRAAAAQVGRLMPLADVEGEVRRRNAERLRGAVARGPIAQNITVQPDARPGWLRLPILAKDAAVAARIVERGMHFGVARAYPRRLPDLAAELGTEFRTAGPADGATELVQRLVTLPVHSLLSEGDLKALEGIVATT